MTQPDTAARLSLLLPACSLVGAPAAAQGAVDALCIAAGLAEPVLRCLRPCGQQRSRAQAWRQMQGGAAVRRRLGGRGGEPCSCLSALTHSLPSSSEPLEVPLLGDASQSSSSPEDSMRMLPLFTLITLHVEEFELLSRKPQREEQGVGRPLRRCGCRAPPLCPVSDHKAVAGR